MSGSQLVEVDGRIRRDFRTGVLEISVFGTVLVSRNGGNVYHVEVATRHKLNRHVFPIGGGVSVA